MKDVMNINECADYLGLSVNTVKKYVRERTIPHTKLNGNVRFLLTKINKWIEDGERK